MPISAQNRNGEYTPNAQTMQDNLRQAVADENMEWLAELLITTGDDGAIDFKNHQDRNLLESILDKFARRTSNNRGQDTLLHHLLRFAGTTSSRANTRHQQLAEDSDISDDEVELDNNDSASRAIDAVTCLLSIPGPFQDDIRAVNDKGETPLHLAAKAGRFVNPRLIQRLKKTSILNQQDRDGNTALHLALIYDLPDMVDALLTSRSVDVNLPNRDGNTALHLAAIARSPKLVQILSRQPSVNVHLRNRDGYTALGAAIMNDNPHDDAKKAPQNTRRRPPRTTTKSSSRFDDFDFLNDLNAGLYTDIENITTELFRRLNTDDILGDLAAAINHAMGTRVDGHTQARVLKAIPQLTDLVDCKASDWPPNLDVFGTDEAYTARLARKEAPLHVIMDLLVRLLQDLKLQLAGSDEPARTLANVISKITNPHVRNNAYSYLLQTHREEALVLAEHLARTPEGSQTLVDCANVVLNGGNAGLAYTLMARGGIVPTFRRNQVATHIDQDPIEHKALSEEQQEHILGIIDAIMQDPAMGSNTHKAEKIARLLMHYPAALIPAALGAPSPLDYVVEYTPEAERENTVNRILTAFSTPPALRGRDIENLDRIAHLAQNPGNLTQDEIQHFANAYAATVSEDKRPIISNDSIAWFALKAIDDIDEDQLPAARVLISTLRHTRQLGHSDNPLTYITKSIIRERQAIPPKNDIIARRTAFVLQEAERIANTEEGKVEIIHAAMWAGKKQNANDLAQQLLTRAFPQGENTAAWDQSLIPSQNISRGNKDSLVQLVYAIKNEPTENDALKAQKLAVVLRYHPELMALPLGPDSEDLLVDYIREHAGLDAVANIMRRYLAHEIRPTLPIKVLHKLAAFACAHELIAEAARLYNTGFAMKDALDSGIIRRDTESYYLRYWPEIPPVPGAEVNPPNAPPHFEQLLEQLTGPRNRNDALVARLLRHYPYFGQIHSVHALNPEDKKRLRERLLDTLPVNEEETSQERLIVSANLLDIPAIQTLIETGQHRPFTQAQCLLAIDIVLARGTTAPGAFTEESKHCAIAFYQLAANPALAEPNDARADISPQARQLFFALIDEAGTEPRPEILTAISNMAACYANVDTCYDRAINQGKEAVAIAIAKSLPNRPEDTADLLQRAGAMAIRARAEGDAIILYARGQADNIRRDPKLEPERAQFDANTVMERAQKTVEKLLKSKLVCTLIARAGTVPQFEEEENNFIYLTERPIRPKALPEYFQPLIRGIIDAIQESRNSTADKAEKVICMLEHYPAAMLPMNSFTPSPLEFILANTPAADRVNILNRMLIAFNSPQAFEGTTRHEPIFDSLALLAHLARNQGPLTLAEIQPFANQYAFWIKNNSPHRSFVDSMTRIGKAAVDAGHIQKAQVLIEAMRVNMDLPSSAIDLAVNWAAEPEIRQRNRRIELAATIATTLLQNPNNRQAIFQHALDVGTQNHINLSQRLFHVLLPSVRGVERITYFERLNLHVRTELGGMRAAIRAHFTQLIQQEALALSSTKTGKRAIFDAAIQALDAAAAHRDAAGRPDAGLTQLAQTLLRQALSTEGPAQLDTAAISKEQLFQAAEFACTQELIPQAALLYHAAFTPTLHAPAEAPMPIVKRAQVLFLVVPDSDNEEDDDEEAAIPVAPIPAAAQPLSAPAHFERLLEHLSDPRWFNSTRDADTLAKLIDRYPFFGLTESVREYGQVAGDPPRNAALEALQTQVIATLQKLPEQPGVRTRDVEVKAYANLTPVTDISRHLGEGKLRSLTRVQLLGAADIVLKRGMQGQLGGQPPVFDDATKNCALAFYRRTASVALRDGEVRPDITSPMHERHCAMFGALINAPFGGDRPSRAYHQHLASISDMTACFNNVDIFYNSAVQRNDGDMACAIARQLPNTTPIQRQALIQKAQQAFAGGMPTLACILIKQAGIYPFVNIAINPLAIHGAVGLQRNAQEQTLNAVVSLVPNRTADNGLRIVEDIQPIANRLARDLADNTLFDLAKDKIDTGHPMQAQIVLETWRAKYVFSPLQAWQQAIMWAKEPGIDAQQFTRRMNFIDSWKQELVHNQVNKDTMFNEAIQAGEQDHTPLAMALLTHAMPETRDGITIEPTIIPNRLPRSANRDHIQNLLRELRARQAHPGDPHPTNLMTQHIINILKQFPELVCLPVGLLAAGEEARPLAWLVTTQPMTAEIRQGIEAILTGYIQQVAPHLPADALFTMAEDLCALPAIRDRDTENLITGKIAEIYLAAFAALAPGPVQPRQLQHSNTPGARWTTLERFKAVFNRITHLPGATPEQKTTLQANLLNRYPVLPYTGDSDRAGIAPPRPGDDTALRIGSVHDSQVKSVSDRLAAQAQAQAGRPAGADAKRAAATLLAHYGHLNEIERSAAAQHFDAEQYVQLAGILQQRDDHVHRSLEKQALLIRLYRHAARLRQPVTPDPAIQRLTEAQYAAAHRDNNLELATVIAAHLPNQAEDSFLGLIDVAYIAALHRSAPNDALAKALVKRAAAAPAAVRRNINQPWLFDAYAQRGLILQYARLYEAIRLELYPLAEALLTIPEIDVEIEVEVEAQTTRRIWTPLIRTCSHIQYCLTQGYPIDAELTFLDHLIDKLPRPPAPISMERLGKRIDALDYLFNALLVADLRDQTKTDLHLLIARLVPLTNPARMNNLGLARILVSAQALSASPDPQYYHGSTELFETILKLEDPQRQNLIDYCAGGTPVHQDLAQRLGPNPSPTLLLGRDGFEGLLLHAIRHSPDEALALSIMTACDEAFKQNPQLARCDFNPANKDGVRASHVAAMRGSKPILEALIAAQPDLSLAALDAQGRSVLDYAIDGAVNRQPSNEADSLTFIHWLAAQPGVPKTLNQQAAGASLLAAVGQQRLAIGRYLIEHRSDTTTYSLSMDSLLDAARDASARANDANNTQDVRAAYQQFALACYELLSIRLAAGEALTSSRETIMADALPHRGEQALLLEAMQQGNLELAATLIHTTPHLLHAKLGPQQQTAAELAQTLGYPNFLTTPGATAASPSLLGAASTATAVRASTLNTIQSVSITKHNTLSDNEILAIFHGLLPHYPDATIVKSAPEKSTTAASFTCEATYTITPNPSSSTPNPRAKEVTLKAISKSSAATAATTAARDTTLSLEISGADAKSAEAHALAAQWIRKQQEAVLKKDKCYAHGVPIPNSGLTPQDIRQLATRGLVGVASRLNYKNAAELAGMALALAREKIYVVLTEAECQKIKDHWESAPNNLLAEFIQLREPQEQIYLAHNHPGTTNASTKKLPLGAQHLLKDIREARRAAKDEDGKAKPIDVNADTMRWLDASPSPSPSQNHSGG